MDTNLDGPQRTSSAIRDKTIVELLPLPALADYAVPQVRGIHKVRPKRGVSEETRQAFQVFDEYVTRHTGNAGHVLRQFIRERPVDRQILVERYDATHPGINHFPDRKLTPVVTKVRVSLEDAWETEGVWCKSTQCMRRHRLVFGVIVPVLLLPILLSPTHPLAVYAYLFDSYNPSLVPEAFAATGTDLASFLTSPAQVERYRADLMATCWTGEPVRCSSSCDALMEPYGRNKSGRGTVSYPKDYRSSRAVGWTERSFHSWGTR